MAFGLVNASCSLPKEQAIKLVFFAPCYVASLFNNTVLLMLFEYYTVEPPLKATKNLKIEGLIAIIKPQRGLDTSTFLKRIKNKLHAISKS